MWGSRGFFAGLDGARRRSIYHACGYGSAELEGPHIGVVNAFNEAAPGHAHLRGLAEAVKAGIWQAGGVPFEFGTISTCGAICVGTKHLRYELVIRDVIAASIEIVATEHLFDGLVLLSSCDSIIPGQILGAARVGQPAVVVTGGPMLPGRHRGRTLVQNEFDEAVLGGVSAGRVSAEEIVEMEQEVDPTAGACPLMGTANTMQILSEALGLALPGTATIPAVYGAKSEAARAAGRRIVGLVQEGRRFRDFVTSAALRNAARVAMALGGSTNFLLHLLAFARELELPFTLEDLDHLSREVPCLTAVIPNGPWDVTEFHAAGGLPALLSELRPVLEPEALTVGGETVGEVAARAKNQNRQVIRGLTDPRNVGGGLAVLKGNLAPHGAICRPSSFGPGMERFRGVARVFDSDEAAYAMIQAGEVQPGTVVVVRYEGPAGAPGMREVMLATDALFGRRAREVALVTDGRFSGFTRGPAIGHVAPEAMAGGPIALVQDGDRLAYDLPGRRLELEVDDAELARRRAAWVQPEPQVTKGILAVYAALAGEAAQGAVMEPKGGTGRS